MSIDQLKVRMRSGPGRLRSASLLGAVGLGLLVGAVFAGTPADAVKAAVPGDTAAVAATEGYAGEARAATASRSAEAPIRDGVVRQASSSDLDELSSRVERVNEAWAGLDEYYEANVKPLERVLYRFSRDSVLVERIAVALVREANQVELEPRLLLAVLLVENPWLDPDIRSSVGATGLMQVMPFHSGSWADCGSDLEDVDANICHGARIFAHYFRASDGDLDRALLRYNGCVNGTNTPDCHQYPNHVFAHAGRASVLAWLEDGPSAR